jgi:hypothetical protein
MAKNQTFINEIVLKEMGLSLRMDSDDTIYAIYKYPEHPGGGLTQILYHREHDPHFEEKIDGEST